MHIVETMIVNKFRYLPEKRDNFYKIISNKSILFDSKSIANRNSRSISIDIYNNA